MVLPLERSLPYKGKSLSLVSKRYVPTPKLGVAFLLVSPMFVAAPFFPWMLLVAVGFDFFLVLVAIYEAISVSGAVPTLVERSIPMNIEVGRRQHITIRLQLQSGFNGWVRWADSSPQSFEFVDPPEGRVVISANTTALLLEYRVLPTRRGVFEFGSLYLRMIGWLGLVSVYSVWRAQHTCKVYPPIPSDIGRFGLARRLAGLRGSHAVHRLVGASGEFESLRRYQTGDDIRLIDWKATARRGQMIVRQNSFERDQRLLVCIDTGRSMVGMEDGSERIEWAMKAAVTLAAEALDAGDRVGVSAIGRGIESFLAPRQGMDQLRRIREHLIAMQPSYGESDFELAAVELKRLLPKRSMIVILSDVPDSASLSFVERGIRLLARHHMVVFAMLRQQSLFEMANKQDAVEEVEVLESLFASNLLRERRLAMRALGSSGALVLDVSANALTLSLLQQYLYVKARGLL